MDVCPPGGAVAETVDVIIMWGGGRNALESVVRLNRKRKPSHLLTGRI